MRQTRRDLLGTTGAAPSVGGLAGCNAADSETPAETGGPDDSSGGSSGSTSTETTAAPEASAATVVTAEWNAMRARLHDAVALGTAVVEG